MINHRTSYKLNLTSLSLSMCHDFYIKVNSELTTSNAVKEAVLWWQEDHKKLNSLWWVLNYYSDKFDPERETRVLIEKHLDNLAEETKTTDSLKN